MGSCLKPDMSARTQSFTLYEITLVPEVWRLTQRADCRVFQQVSTPEIVAQVLKLAGVGPGYRLDLHRRLLADHDYCVQYRETDLDFLARLLEDAGIHYYFEHSEDRHVLVMTDDGQGGRSIAGDPQLRLADEDEVEHLSRFALRDSMRPQRVTLRDMNLHAPATPVEGSKGSGNEREVYDYPGGFTRRPARAGRSRPGCRRSCVWPRCRPVGASARARVTARA